jgi:hypothetical protein
MDRTRFQIGRRDGWTAARQLTFLSELARTHKVAKAARAAGMSRESAYRLRARDPHGLFAAAWDRALKGHKVGRRGRAGKRATPDVFGGFRAMWTKGHEMEEPWVPSGPRPAS